MQIKSFKTEEKLIKTLLKILKKDIRKNPYSRIGIDGESLSFLFDSLINCSKIDWTFVKLFSPIEYFNQQSLSFADKLKENLAKKLLNFNLENFENLSEKINYLKEKNAINGLYKYKDGLDILIFYLDYRGNFLLNDYESKISFLNFSTNGEKLVSPGIKSILLAKKIIFICKDNNDQAKNIVKNFVSKKIYENELYTFLNFHENFCFLTLKDLVNTADISLSMSNQDYNAWHDILFANDLDPNSDIDITDNEQVVKNDNQLNMIDENNIQQPEQTLKEEDQTYIEKVENLKDASLKDELNVALEKLDLEKDDNSLFNDNDNKDEGFSLENIFKVNVENEPKKELDMSDNVFIKNEDMSSFEKDEDQIKEKEDFKSNLISDEEISNLNDMEDSIEEKIDSVVENDNFDLDIKDNIDLDNDMFDYFENDLPNIDDSKSAIVEEIDISNESNVSNSQKENTINIKPELSSESQNNAYEDNWFKSDDQNIENKSSKTNSINSDTNWFDESNGEIDFRTSSEWYKEEDKKDFLNKTELKKVQLPKIDYNLNDVESLQKIIAIKEKTLNEINELLKDINLNSNQISKKMIFKYCPDIRPCPLLMVFNESNKQEYENQVLSMKTIFSTKTYAKPFDPTLNHLWNHAAYISYNPETLEINLMAFTDFAYIIFLLRYLNKELWMKVDSSLISIFEENKEIYKEEFLLISMKK